LITTDRLILRPFAEDDLMALHRLWSDPLTIWWGPITTVDQSRILLSRAIAEGWFAVMLDDQLIGDVFLRPSRHDADALELGYHFLPSNWGRGYATEACSAVMGTATSKRVQAPIVPENHRSRRVATKVGMTIIGQVERGGLLHDLWERGASSLLVLLVVLISMTQPTLAQSRASLSGGFALPMDVANERIEPVGGDELTGGFVAPQFWGEAVFPFVASQLTHRDRRARVVV
jgi:RimJ/RimL family protein N-acetyltransferase